MDEASKTADARTRKPAGGLWPVLLSALAMLAIAGLRGPLAEHYKSATVRSDVFALPPPQETVAASLGYRSALADLIYAHTLVGYGMHFQERRLFEFVGNYLDTINALDPQFRDPYRFADTLLTLQARDVPTANYRKAREVLERGLKELPYDAELWSSTGQFLAYIASARLPDPKEREAWRLDGARKLARACELIGNNQNIPYHCITAARILDDAGERAATTKFLERVLLVNDDPKIIAMARAALDKYASEGAGSEVASRKNRLQKLWGADLPFVSRSALFVLGPRANVAGCAGLDAQDSACASSWSTWAERMAEHDANPDP